ncbi:SDR family NAD(P)-dependent oxidoreductase, partial [Pseudonocardia xinjiangensis]
MTTNAVKTAIVTGASSPFGAAYALRLAERGYVPVLVGRAEGRLEDVAASIARQTGVTAEVLVADLTSSQDVERLEGWLRTDESVEFLVNAAGAAVFAPSPGFDTAATEQMIALNVIAATRLTTAALAGLTARGRGTVVNVSSAMAFWHQPVSSVYSATKSYVLTFSQALQQELAGSGVTVQVVVPGAMRTEFWDGSGIDISVFSDEYLMSPEVAVDAALAGLDAGEVVTIPSLADIGSWEDYEKARGVLAPILSRDVPAERYRR